MEYNLDSRFKYFFADKQIIEKINEDNIIEVFGFKIDATQNYNDLKSVLKNIEEKIKEYFPDSFCYTPSYNSEMVEYLNIYIHHSNEELLKELKNHFSKKYELKENGTNEYVAKKIGNWEIKCDYYYSKFDFKNTFSIKLINLLTKRKNEEIKENEENKIKNWINSL